MKLATLDNGTRDGELLVVSGCGHHALRATDLAPTLQAALDQWERVEAPLRERSAALNGGDCAGQFPVEVAQLLAPLPRAYEWIDGSAYINHIVLVRKARGAEPPATLRTDPLVYQGGSGVFLGPTDPIRHFSTDFGIDFEAEVAVVTGDVPMGTRADQAAGHIKLLMLVNDVSLRMLIPAELQKGFGFFVSKPATAFAPFAVTPDELGPYWRDGRLHLPMLTRYNGEFFGNPDAGPEMHFSFHDLIGHVTQTRALTAGTIIGSGTVSNLDRRRGSSCLAEKRMIEKIESGDFQTPFMQFGDTIEIEMQTPDGKSVFGMIRQRVEQAERVHG